MINDVPLLKKRPSTGLLSSRLTPLRQERGLYSGTGAGAGVAVAVNLSVMCSLI